MNKYYQDAALRLHKFATEDTNSTELELRAELAAQGIDADEFLSRLANEAGIKTAVPSTTKKPSAAERLRALASRAGSEVKGLLHDPNADGTMGLPVAAYGRSGHRGKSSRLSLHAKKGKRPKK